MSQVFRPYRALGLVGERIPFALQHHGAETFLSTSLGKNFHTYNCDKLRLSFVSALHERKIRAILMQKEFVITGAGPLVHIWKRGKAVAMFKGHQATITHLYAFGDHLLSVSRDSVLKIWDMSECTKIASKGELTTVETEDQIEFAEGFHVSCMTHPSTYLNKMLFCSQEGAMQLWNLKTKKLVYAFKGWGSPIISVAQSPAVDVIGVGLADGRIIMHNLRFDTTLFTFTVPDAQITSISFRTDGPSVLVAATDAGRVTVWDLEGKKLIAVMKDVHQGPVVAARFLPEQPVMITSGTDNAIKMWIFDHADQKPRLLRERSGHSLPPRRIRYYGDGTKAGNVILSAGSDRSLRIFSTVQEQQSRELSQGHLKKSAKRLRTSEHQLKLPSIFQFDSSPAKEQDWDNLVTLSDEETVARSWNTHRYVLGKNTYRTPRSTPSTVAVSTCGNYAIIGGKDGRISSFNLQSSKLRAEFPKHRAQVTGLAVDYLNSTLISISLDGIVNFSQFSSKPTLLGSVALGSSANNLAIVKESGLIAVACDDLVVRVIDIESRRVVRRFAGHRHAITDMAWSPDARLLVTASMDATLRVWDVPGAMLIDWFSVATPVVSLSFSPVGDFLATAHTGQKGIFLWSNEMYFSKVLLRPVAASPALAHLPNVISEEGDETDKQESELAGKESDDDKMETVGADAGSKFPEEQLKQGLVTMGKGSVQWQNLPNLSTIKERNKPIAPPKKPAMAPFLLPVVSGLEPKFLIPTQEGDKDASQVRSRILNMSQLVPKTKFIVLLEEAKYDEAMDHLRSQSASGVDVELKTINLENGANDLRLVVDFLVHQLESGKDFGHIQAYINIVLKAHGEVMVEQEHLQNDLKRLREAQRQSWARLESLFHHNLCLVAYFQNIQT